MNRAQVDICFARLADLGRGAEMIAFAGGRGCPPHYAVRYRVGGHTVEEDDAALLLAWCADEGRSRVVDAQHAADARLRTVGEALAVGAWVALDDGTYGLVTEIQEGGRIPRLHVEYRRFPSPDAIDLGGRWVWPANVVGDGPEAQHG